MEVRDIFAMRKEKGKAEEAYRAISDIFAVHQGPHTNTCMFWCASDLLHQRIKEKERDKARQLLGQMVKVYPTIKDGDCRAARAISRAALGLDRLVPGFNLVFFMPWFRLLTEEDWLPTITASHRVPSLGQQIVNRLMRNIAYRDAAYIEQVTDLFRCALRHQPFYKENLRHLAQMHVALGQRDEAIRIFKGYLRRHRSSNLYWELSRLIDDEAVKTALLCLAITGQHRERFRAKYHLELALLLMKQKLLPRAAYELRQCIAIRTRQRQPITPYLHSLLQSLGGIAPVSQADEQVLYGRSINFVAKWLGQL